MFQPTKPPSQGWSLEFIYIFNLHPRTCLLILKRGEQWLALVCAPTRDQIRNLGMCPDQELNLRPFSLQEDAEPSYTGQEFQEPAIFKGSQGNSNAQQC